MCHQCDPSWDSYHPLTSPLLEDVFCGTWLDNQDFSDEPDPDDIPTTLYRFYTERDELIYIGITSRGRKRIYEHAEKYWFYSATKIILEHFANRQSALEHERWAIITEHPIDNLQHTDNDTWYLFDACEFCKRIVYPESTSIMYNKFCRECHYECPEDGYRWGTRWRGLTGDPSFQ